MKYLLLFILKKYVNVNKIILNRLNRHKYKLEKKMEFSAK